ncbi:hypothetical protein TSUD_291410 [Trifolium subterraneum]|uniref:Uncharacterized protein n=1 Tax=Trifolium subterraneum TaxID=3900 RepID=A0A2Z6PK01_TRISU|nr:hypothetical protein TSUD_291410 [Trifolium subterraneum]
MDPLPPPLLWNPEDDFLLMEAIEYSLKELTERWGSLLYDSDVAEEASTTMAEFEIAKCHGNKIKEAAKKKVDSPMRKTQNICKEEAKVAEVIVEEEGVKNIKWRWRRNLFEWEKEMVEVCSGLVLNVKRSDGEGDSWKWGEESYSVNEAYQMIKEGEENEETECDGCFVEETCAFLLFPSAASGWREIPSSSTLGGSTRV